MNKLPLANLPYSDSPIGSYDRLLNVKLNELLGEHRRIINNLITNPNLPIFANNAAAITGGLVAGDFYRTGANPDFVAVVH